MKLSIITVNLNNGDGLKKTLDSVQAQSFRDIEQIVIDGGSTDNSLDVMSALQSAIDCWVSEPDRGVYHAMNKGIHIAQGDYVYFLNSGDRLSSNDVLFRVFKDDVGDEDFIYGHTLRCHGSCGTAEAKLSRNPPDLSIRRFFGFGLCHQAVLYRRKLFDIFGFYNEDFEIVADWEFTVRLLLAGCTTKYVDIPIAYYEGGGLSERLIGLREEEKERFLRNHLSPVVYNDYLYYVNIEHKLNEVETYKNWALSIKDRNFFINLLMITKWFFEKVMNRIVTRGGNNV